YLKHRELLTDPYFLEASRRFAESCVATKEYSNSTVGHYTKQSGYFMDYLAAQGRHDFTGVSMHTLNTYILTLSGFSYKTVEQHICPTRVPSSGSFLGKASSGPISHRRCPWSRPESRHPSHPSGPKRNSQSSSEQ